VPYLFDHLDSVQELLSDTCLGLITDIDGTISRTAPTPAQAEVSPLCRNYLFQLAKHLPLVAVVSGRPVVEMREMVGIEEIVYIGNHGFERWESGGVRPVPGMESYSGVIEKTLKELKHLLDIQGILFDSKGVTASIHYRLCRDKDAARRKILASLARARNTNGLVIREGKMAIELRPLIPINKGSATLELIDEYNLRKAVYLGDDLTDVDAFRAIRQAGFHGVAVGVINEEAPREVDREADYTVNGVGEVERFLEWLVRVTNGMSDLPFGM